jgi:hypothetical protein
MPRSVYVNDLVLGSGQYRAFSEEPRQGDVTVMAPAGNGATPIRIRYDAGHSIDLPAGALFTLQDIDMSRLEAKGGFGQLITGTVVMGG